jgi:hypothetical protein
LHCQALTLDANISNGLYSYLKAHSEGVPIIFIILEKNHDVEGELETMKVMQDRFGA